MPKILQNLQKWLKLHTTKAKTFTKMRVKKIAHLCVKLAHVARALCASFSISVGIWLDNLQLQKLEVLDMCYQLAKGVKICGLAIQSFWDIKKTWNNIVLKNYNYFDLKKENLPCSQKIFCAIRAPSIWRMLSHMDDHSGTSVCNAPH